MRGQAWYQAVFAFFLCAFICAYRRAPSNDLPHPATRSRGRRRRSPATRRGLQRAGKEVHEASGTV
jgi:hypothetical protein